MRGPFAASALVYAAVTAVLARDLLADLDSTVAHDAGDPLLTGAILHWNASQLPLTEAWWQFPSFHPLRDTLAFSEHLLGLSVVSAPVAWLVGDPLVAYNLTVLLTFVLCGAAMYLLVHRFTGSAAAAFIAGLAFAFSPYRISQLSHVQMLATFWAPLALLGLHGYLETRKPRWLVLYGVAWLLQAASNGYALIFFSILVGLWVLWFLAARQDWRAVGAVAAATAVAAVPLVPILVRYVRVHAFHGFERTVEEMQIYSADVAAVLCASNELAVWGWLRVACRAEGELFPGLAVAILAAGLLLAAVVRHASAADVTPSSRLTVWLRRGVLAVAAMYAAAGAAVLAYGPWQIDLPFGAVSASSVWKPLRACLVALGLAMLLTPSIRRRLQQGSIPGFYGVAAVLTWLLALGPTVTFMTAPTNIEGPFAWLLTLPGLQNLRVPARFWMLTSLCLAVLAGFAIAAILNGRTRLIRGAITAAIAGVVLADGWVSPIRTEPASAQLGGGALLTGATVLSLPIGQPYPDAAAQWRAAVGGWRPFNGYSGYFPAHYATLVRGLATREPDVITALRRMGPLHVDVPAEDPDGWRAWLTAQFPEARLVGGMNERVVYLLPTIEEPQAPLGAMVPFTIRSTSCGSLRAPVLDDGNVESVWRCHVPNAHVVLELSAPGEVTGVGYAVGPASDGPSRLLRIEVSPDGTSWREVVSGTTAGEELTALLRDHRRPELLFRFAPTTARFVRITQTDGQRDFLVAELRIFAAP